MAAPRPGRSALTPSDGTTGTRPAAPHPAAPAAQAPAARVTSQAPLENISTKVPRGTRRALKTLAAKTDEDIQRVVSRILTEALSKEKLNGVPLWPPSDR